MGYHNCMMTTMTNNTWQIASEIEEIARQADAKPPQSEWDTIYKVIGKILEKLAGYTVDDIAFEETSLAGRPDIVFPYPVRVGGWRRRGGKLLCNSM